MIGAAFKLSALALVAGLCAVAAHAQPSALVVGGPFQALPQNVNAGATDVTVLRFNLARTGKVATAFTDLDVTVAGTATSSDVSGFDLYADEDNNGAVMSVERGGNTVASGFTSHDNLGSVPSSGAPFVYDIKNIGTTDLTLTGTPDAVEISNMVNCNVLVTQPSPLVITPARQVSFTLDVTPSGSGPAIGFRVTIPSNDPASPHMFNVIGETAIAAPASLAITTQPGGGTLDFEDNASVLTGTSSAPFRVTGGPPMIIPAKRGSHRQRGHTA